MRSIFFSISACLWIVGCSGSDLLPDDSGSGGAFGETGGATGTTGGAAAGGTWSSGGASSGGAAATGGNASGGSTSGGSGTGGGASGGSGGITSNCTEAEGEVCSNGIGTHCGYTYEYWKDQGSGCQTNTADGFSVEWNNINNLLGRKGVRPGTASNVVTYDADYQPNGNSYLCVYGWTKSPLIEYYIVDSWGDWRPPGGTSLGTVTSDGGTYDIYKTERVNQPSIEGTKTFFQYWSVRQGKRTSGSITVGNHFAAWEAKDMDMGALYEVSMTVEGYQSSGTATVSMSIE